ncbi:MAG: hypothetical protein AB8G15_14060 [Saprospiraceae bacterium]
MKTFLFRLLTFVTFLAVLLLGLNIFQSKYNLDPPHYARHYQELYQVETKSNAIIIGASHAVHGIRPSLLQTENFQFYNFALNGAGPQFYLKWYEDLFSKQYPKPKVCFYAVDWFMFNEDWLWRNFEADSEYFAADLFINCLRSKELNRTALLQNRLAFFKYRKQLLSALSFKTENLAFPVKAYDRGFIPFKTAFKEKNFVYEEDVEMLVSSFDEKKALISLLEKMQAAGIQIIFVMPPEYQLTAEIYQSPPALFLDSLAEVLTIPYLNFNTNLRSDTINSEITNFSDWGHLNAEGSFKFSSALRKEWSKLEKAIAF